MKKDDIKSSADLFLYFGLQDLAAARLLLESDEIDVQVVMFHLQQAAEKLLKSLLSHHGIEIAKTHDIERLIDICQEHEIALPPGVETMIDLNLFAVEGRYFIIGDDFADAENYMECLGKLAEYVDRIVRNFTPTG